MATRLPLASIFDVSTSIFNGKEAYRGFVTSTSASQHVADRSARLAVMRHAVGHDGTAVLGAHLLDAEVDLLVVADEAEHIRRTTVQAGALANWDVLRVLTGLPRWEPVPLRSLTSRERTTVRNAPDGAVEITDGNVTRLAGPPVAGVLAVVTDTDWDRGLNVASRFAPVATRVLVLANEPSDLPVAAAEAAEYGIGLALRTAESLRMIVAAELWRENYFSPGSWLFREQAYQAYLDQAAVVQSIPVTARG
jgi:hypothetical protein